MTEESPPTGGHDGEAADQETLRLDQFLKLCGMAESGGNAKFLIQGGNVKVNGQVETRRRRKLVHGDVVEIGGESIQVHDSEQDADPSPDE